MTVDGGGAGTVEEVCGSSSGDDENAPLLSEQAAMTAAGSRRTRSYKRPHLWTYNSHAVPLFYFLLGFLTNFPRVALRKFCMDDLHVSPAMQQLILSVIMQLPWNFKILYGFVSDALPICGQHRKPYMSLGVFICSLSWILNGAAASSPTPSIGLACILLFMATFGMIFTDVMADTLVVERMRYEEGDDIGSMQTLCWCLRLAGQVTGLLAGGWALSIFQIAPALIFTLNGMVPLVALPSLYLLVDGSGSLQKESEQGRKYRQQRQLNVWMKMRRIWDVLQEPYMWRPMIFIFVAAATPSSADAFVNYMLLKPSKGGLGISLQEYTYILAVGQVASILGAYLYQYHLSHVNWRYLFYAVMLLSFPLSLSQLIVIFRWHEKWHISSFGFLFGSEVVNDVVGFLIQMPILIMCAKLCPKSVEGTVYALQVSTNNIGLSVGAQLGASLTDAFGVTMENMGNLWMLTLVCIVLGMCPIFLVPCLPESPDKKIDGAKSPCARYALVCIVLGSFLITTGGAIFEIAAMGTLVTQSDMHHARGHIRGSLLNTSLGTVVAPETLSNMSQPPSMYNSTERWGDHRLF